jgi:hypothetical protein
VRSGGRVEVVVSASTLLAAAVSSWSRLVTVRRGLGAATMVGAPDVLGTDVTEAGGEVDIDVDGAGNLLVTIMGEPATTINWSIQLYCKAGLL